ncbi:hypothetical protein [Oceanobacillus damuensis]|uniref:hypothetical protein n=1 Tax=Oceanobacillus damuensis TaxID=937928 RepID=UPI0008341E30|nr:hypothetical protein [Oceanobacillus damuensis]
MIKKFIMISVLLVAAGCSSNSKAIEKVDTVPLETEKQPALIEQEEEDEIEQYIEFFLNDEQVLINLQMVPILKEYLNGVKNRKATINEMKLERLPLDDHQIYLLEFSCFSEACSYLLFNQSGENPAYLVADLAKFKKMLVSPEESKVAIQFGRINNQNFETDHLVVTDLKQWKVLSLNNETNDANILNYKWPYVTVHWIDEESLNVNIPDVIEPSSQNFSEWSQLGESTLTETILTTGD